MFIPYTHPDFLFSGVWQENGNGEIVSYKSAAFTQIGFTGSRVRVEASLKHVAQFYIDGKEVWPQPNEAGFTFVTGEGEHLLKICTRINHHIFLKGIHIDDDEKTFAPPKRPYIHIIGDSITQAYPGYSTVCGELFGDYSIVALGGMALSDGWGWYAIPEGLEARVGMESNYFKLEYPFESVDFTDYRFDFCRQPDVVTIYLGTNDFLDNPTHWENGHLDMFYPKYAAFIEKIRKQYPKARIYILNALSDKMFRRQGIEKAFEEAKKTVDDIYLLNIQDWDIEVSDDGTHPSLKGYNDLGEKLGAYLKKELSL